MKKIYDAGTVTGDLEMIFRDVESGEIVDHFEDRNVILLEGKSRLLGYLQQTPTEATHIDKIVLGSDVGNGTVMQPEMANENLTSADQIVLYETKPHEFSSGSPTQNSVRFVAALSGETIMSEHPTVPNVVYNSATLRFADGSTFAYRRFAPRTISNLVYVDIIWTITIH